ncbi:metallophosphoesterase [Candidatus Woesearchaeota archaeon]|nr:metallophosphoesterase [Candidatus Woesearchaeota archaeon]
MKVLLCSDIHNPRKDLVLLREKSEDVDFVVCAGDFTNWGSGLVSTLREMNSWGKSVFVVHGNHEDESEVRRVCKSLENVVFFHRDVVDFNGFQLVGWGGGGFSLQDKDFERFVSGLNISDFSRVILVTHAPPFETCLDEIQKGVFVGNDSIKRFVLSSKPLVVVSGHIHETSGLVCNLDGVLLINPGPEGVIVEL